MARKKYQNKKQNMDARLEAEGLRREAGRIVPIQKSKPVVDAENTVLDNKPVEKKVVVPPYAKAKEVKKPAAKKSSKPETSTTQYSWLQKAVVFTVVFGLVAVGFAALAGTTQTPTPTETVTPSPSEQIISEQTITVPPAEEPSK